MRMGENGTDRTNGTKGRNGTDGENRTKGANMMLGIGFTFGEGYFRIWVTKICKRSSKFWRCKDENRRGIKGNKEENSIS